MSKAREITICHANEIPEVNETSTYSPWFPCIISSQALSHNLAGFVLETHETFSIRRKRNWAEYADKEFY